MNPSVKRLYEIANKNKRLVLGLMSGTSLDGLDIALCEMEGAGAGTKVMVKQFVTRHYTTEMKIQVRKIFAQEQVSLRDLCLLNEWIAIQHANLVNDTLRTWEIPAGHIDLIASHGQTVYHAPKHLHPNDAFGNGTLQIGDGDHLAVLTGIITVSDFRQKHIAAGGEGAPLAAYGDYILFKEKDADVILLNIGGIANFTFLPKHGKMFSTDTGPGNTMMDAWMLENFTGYSYDENAFVARSGTIDQPLLDALKQHDFFKAEFPKTTGPELFNLSYLEAARKKSGTAKLGIHDVMATLNRFTAETICDAIHTITENHPGTKIYVSGGGIYNILLMEHLIRDIRHATVGSTAEKNINPDAKEAVLFAVLANETIAGNATMIPAGLKNFPAVTMGKISFPF